jgi:hypothetical protein
MPSKFIKDIDICPFTGLKIKPEYTFDIQDPEKVLWFIYRNEIVKDVSINHTEYTRLRGKYLSQEKKYLNNLYIYKGVIRNYNINYNIPYIVDSDLIDLNFDYSEIPKEFRQKVYYFLKNFYDNGGKEFKIIRFICPYDYPLSYSENSDEFQRIIEYSEDKGFLKYETEPIYSEGKRMVNVELRFSTYGLEEIEKELPIMPMWDLVKQDVFTGNTDIDEKIFHAKKLFFKVNSTFDDKRSACETLSFILEPLRDKLEKYFSDKDISTFFNIVNSFDIRHNKERTQQLERVEQLEWIFYTLLNTIIIYNKILKTEN